MPFSASHSIACNASRAQVYGLIRDSAHWPQIFEPCIAVEVLESTQDAEHIQVTARVNGLPMTWRSRRRFLPEVHGIESVLTQPMKLVSAMATSWRVVAINNEQCLLVLEHAYDLEADIEGQVDGVRTLDEARRFIESAIDGNSRTELGNIKAAVERAPRTEPAVQPERHASHSVLCEASADSVYAVIRDTANWPRIFDACVSATRVRGDATRELVHIEAVQDGHPMAWDTQRTYFDTIRRIDYELPVPMPFLSSMKGQWRVVPLGEGRCLLSVDRSWRLLDDVRGIRPGIETVAQAAALFDAFVNDNAEAEMRAIRNYVEGGTEAHATVTTSRHLPFPPDAVYGVLADVALWPDVLPHCLSLEVAYDDSEYQEFSMRVKTPLGAETFRSIRRCHAAGLSITYFQPKPPAVLESHHGSWQVRSAPGGSLVIAEHSVRLNSAACVAAFGDTDTLLHKQRIKHLLSTNSGATLDACQAWLEARAGIAQAAAEGFHE